MGRNNDCGNNGGISRFARQDRLLMGACFDGNDRKR